MEPHQEIIAKEAILDGSLKDGLYTTDLKLSERINKHASTEESQREQSETSVDLPPAATGNNIMFVSRTTRTATEWHDALNHCNPHKLLNTARIVDGITLTTTVTKCGCLSCQMGKATNTPFPDKSNRIVTRPGEVISTDTWGPATHPDWNGNRYFVSFLCHYTSKSWVYLYANKEHLKDITEAFLNLIFNQTGRHVSYFRYDKEGGYVSTIVQTF
jgi:hypothetical protein